MAFSSILGGQPAAIIPEGKTSGALGPSDSSDTGSDAQGELGPDQLDSDTDRFGTGERASVHLEQTARSQDILPDHVVDLDAAANSDEADADIDAHEDADEEADTLALERVDLDAAPDNSEPS